MLGISIGFAVMVTLVGIGLMQIFDLWPASYVILQTLRAIYLVYLAYKIAHAARPETSSASTNPMSFLQAAIFQWVNPKAWTMALTAITLFAPDRSWAAVLFVALTFAVLNGLWAAMGQQMRRFLNSPTQLRISNWTMAVLLEVSMIPSLLF